MDVGNNGVITADEFMQVCEMVRPRESIKVIEMKKKYSN